MQTTVKIEDFLRRVCAALELNKIPYMVTGSVASSIHGIPRSTNDLDIVVAPTRAQLFALVQMFKRLGYHARWEEAENALRNRDQFNVIDFPNSWKVDLIVRKAREFSQSEFDRRELMEIGDLSFVIAKPEDVLIAKLEWMKISPSERQMQDAAGIVIVQQESLDWAYIDKWVATLELQEQLQAVRQLAG
jgi:hypothetical protein